MMDLFEFHLPNRENEMISCSRHALILMTSSDYLTKSSAYQNVLD